MEGLNLTKGAVLDLTKKEPWLNNVKVGLGWDVDGSVSMDLDVAAFVKESGSDKVTNVSNICFFNQKNILNGSIVHAGDNRTGAGEGDDESIDIDLAKVVAELPNVSEIHFAVFIFEPSDADVTFWKVKNSFIRIINKDGDKEIAKYKLEDDHFSSRAINFWKLSKNSSWNWEFTAVDEEIVGQVDDAVSPTFAHFTA